MAAIIAKFAAAGGKGNIDGWVNKDDLKTAAEHALHLHRIPGSSQPACRLHPAPACCSTGDNPPGVGTGHMAAVQGRYSVTYRLVNRVYAMVVAPAASNVFLSMQLLDAAAKVLVGVSRGVDVTPAKVAKRYTEVTESSGSAPLPGLGLAGSSAGHAPRPACSHPPVRLVLPTEAYPATPATP